MHRATVTEFQQAQGVQDWRVLDAGVSAWFDAPSMTAGAALVRRIATRLDGLPVIGTGAGHDAGILANDGIRSAMLFVRNPTGVSHSPDEWASADDCLDGIAALADVVTDLAGAGA